MNSTNKTKTSLAKFEEFFSTIYKDDVFAILEKYPDERSLTVNYEDLEMFDPDLADLLIDKPDEVIAASQKAIKNIDPLMKDAELNIRFENLTNNIPLSDLLSKYIGNFVSADGIVRKTDEIRPRIETGVFECRGCMRIHEVEQSSGNHIMEPSLCSECGGRSFRLLQEESKYIDTQSARMQEPLENLSGGTEPKQMLMVLEDDLVDELNPGDKVRITGTLKTFREERSGKFKNYIYVNHIEPLEQEFEELELSEEDEAKILELSKDPHIHDKIINSTAPSIRGYRDVKEAIALQLFGGAVKELEDGTRLRGDIHILIVGDPGIGKSQILKYVSKLAPRSVYTSGKGTSGAGLTAAAVRDELGGWSLEAGALVLGDQGNVCVDELADQIDLPAPILSRFDLQFVIEDKPNVDNDRAIAQHILKIHQSSNVDYEIEPELLRKYIAYARKNIHPKLTDEANKVLEEFYVSVRMGGVEDDTPVPITARQLEAIIRLAEASAKLQLKEEVDAEDARRAITLQKKCLEAVGMDPDTGKIDIDKVEGRTPTSDRDRIKKVMDEIGVLEAEFVNVPVDILKEHLAENYEMSGEKVDAILKQLKGKGFIYEPRNGLVKRLEN